MTLIGFYNCLTVHHGDGRQRNATISFHRSLIFSRTHSDSSLHHAMMPSVVAHYHARMENDNNGIYNIDIIIVFVREHSFHIQDNYLRMI